VKRPTISGIAWFLINGIPLLVICVVGLSADMINWDWLARSARNGTTISWRARDDRAPD
jgi:hypothetical protein